MNSELSDEAQALIREAVALELPAGTARRAELKRELLRRSALLGAGAVVAATLEPAHGAGAAPAGGAALAGAAAKSTGAGALGVLFAKGAAVGLVVAGALHGVTQFSTRGGSGSAASTSQAPARAPVEVRLRAAPPPAGAVSSASPTDVAAPPASAASAGSPPSVGSATNTAPGAAGSARPTTPPRLDAAPSGSSASLHAELELLGAVQAALRDGRPARALELIDRYGALFPHSQLENERLAAEAVAACQSGDEARGRQAAELFLRRDHTSAMAERVRRVCPTDGASRAR